MFQGVSFIGCQRGKESGKTSQAINPADGQALDPAYHHATAEEVEQAVQKAAEASGPFGSAKGKERAAFLRQIADNIEAIGDELAERGPAETGLPEGRIRMETGRTCGQLRLFASLAENGSWADARIDHADPDRQPIPKPDVRSVRRPIGPVAVFCASNFPLAFSVAGGDTASALAAGNPVIVKAHHAHPGCAELVGEAIQKAVASSNLPEGVFSLLYGPGFEVGKALVQHPQIKGVGFTGSRKGGRALMDLAAAREEPIPVYAEMSSINPVVILPGAMAERASALATGLHGSVTLGCGQFCTNPGLVFVDSKVDASAFVSELSKLMGETPGAAMLTEGICQAYASGKSNLANHAGVKTLAEVANEGNCGGAALFETDGETFLKEAALQDEIFGPATLLVRYQDEKQLEEIIQSLEGQLTATVHSTEDELAANATLIQHLEKKVGRLVFNGFPTGVEVCSSMVHGGPYPATSDGRSTSVGTAAIFRFSRPVCYQSFPDKMLPAELQESNPLALMRLVNGEYQKA